MFPLSKKFLVLLTIVITSIALLLFSAEIIFRKVFPDSMTAPAGHYLLFLIDQDRKPSEAKIIHIS